MPADDTLPIFASRLKPTSRSRLGSRRAKLWLALLVTVLLLSTLVGRIDKARTTLHDVHTRASLALHPSHSLLSSKGAREYQPVKHLLLPVASSNADLCKLLLTSSSLGYPRPHLLGWNNTANRPFQDDGGVRIDAIPQALKYFNGLGPGSDDDLVIILDGPNVWFQLPPDVIVKRYFEIVEAADSRLARHLGGHALRGIQGRGLDVELRSAIVFAAGKKCEPNQPHTIACYTVPPSLLSPDLYGGNTDTPIGRTEYSSHRQRYLDSTYAVGSVAAMRKLFKSAAEIVEQYDKFQGVSNHQVGDPSDSGRHESDHLYHGSAQSIFAKLFGRQQYVREILRRGFDPVAGTRHDKSEYESIEGTEVVDILNPSFQHEKWGERYWEGYFPWKIADSDLWKTPPVHLLERYEFGITLDYSSVLGHHTRHSEYDARWLVHSAGSQELLKQQINENTRNAFDCSLHLPRELPSDITASRFPALALSANKNATWSSTPLYTHLCHGSIPAFVHTPTSLLFGSDSQPHPWDFMSWLWKGAHTHFMGPSIYEADGTSPAENEATENAEQPTAGTVGKVDEERQGPGMGGAWTDLYSVSYSMVCST